MGVLQAAAMVVSVTGPVRAEPPDEDSRPLSPAQIALFETPHLSNIAQPETLDYSYTRDSVAGFSDHVALHIRKVNPDGTKSLAFDYLTGERQVRFPELDHFRGNPLLMLTLERDVGEMKEAIGLSTTYFRNRIREAFVTGAVVTPSAFTLAGASVPAQEITIRPFQGETRLERIPSLQAKTYTFVLADAVPGTVAEIRIATPADAVMAVPAFSQRLTFTGVTP